MKWGDKAPNGCKKVPCDKLHPQVCPRSLDLTCLEVNCDLKLHVKKCVRKGRASFNNQQRSGSRSTLQSTRQRGNRVQQPWSRNETYRQSSFVRNPWSGNNNIENNFHMFQGQHGLSTSNQESHNCGMHDSSVWNQNLSQRWTTSSPAVHRFLEVWAGNMQKEIARQMREIHSLIENQGGTDSLAKQHCSVSVKE